MTHVADEWVEEKIETTQPPVARNHIGSRQFVPNVQQSLDGVVNETLTDPDYPVRVLAGSVGALALLTLDARKAERQVTFNSFRKLLKPAYEYVFSVVRKHDPNVRTRPEARARYLHTLSVDFHPTEGYIDVRVTYEDTVYLRRYHFRLQPIVKTHLEKLPSLATMDDRPHQHLRAKL